MPIIRKAIVTPRDFDEVLSCGYTVAQVAREAGIDRISLSKFRNHGQALKAADQAALVSWLQENDLWDDNGTDRGKPSGPAPTDSPAIQVFPRPLVAIQIGKELDGDDAERLSARTDFLISEIKLLLDGKVTYEDGLFSDPNDLDEASNAAYQKAKDYLAELALTQFRLQGNDLAPPLPSKHAKPDARLSTFAELLARDFPWPASVPNPDLDADPSEESLAAGTKDKAQGRGQTPAKSGLETLFG